MALDNREKPGAPASADEPFDWFTNVIRTDLKSDPDVHVAAPRRPVGPFRAALGRLVGRYQRLPSWVVIPQLFLAFAWGRSGLAHLLQGDWWDGSQVVAFLTANNGFGLGAHRFLLEAFVEPLPTAAAVVVLAMELTIAVLLLLSHRVTLALGLGAFLNVQLILAGEVNPSLFFLLAAVGIGIWRLETSASARFLNRLTGAALVAGIAVVAFLAPAVRSFGPEAALDDPALMLILLTVLTVAALWWINRRVAAAERTLAKLIEGDPRSTPNLNLNPNPNPARTEPSLRTVALSLVVAAVIILGGVALFDESERGIEQADGSAPTADEVPPIGSLEVPYPQGLDVSLNYNDLGRNENQAWRIQILETVTDEAGPTRARVRLSYDGGSSQGAIDDFEFSVVDLSGVSSPAGAEACDGQADSLAGGGLDVGRSTEGWVCWSPSNESAAELVMAVVAKPADGVLYMALGE